MAELPKFIALKSVKNQKYVVYKDQTTAELEDILQCSGEDAHSEYARFKVEKDIYHPDLVHIKSTYIDKYWSASNQSSPWIVAGADQKRTNKNLWSCTLLKPEVVLPPLTYVNGKYQFRHVHMGNLIEPKPGTDFDNALAAEQGNPSVNTIFIVEKLPG